MDGLDHAHVDGPAAPPGTAVPPPARSCPAAETAPVRWSPVAAPGALPLLGHAPRMLRDRLAFLEELRDLAPVTEIRLGRERVLVISDHRLVRDVLVRRASDFGLSPHFRVMRRIIGNGLLATDGAFHRQQRRIMLPAFTQARMPHYARTMTALTEQHLGRWCPGRTLDLDRELTALATEAVARCLFGTGVPAEDIADVVAAVPHLMAWAGSRGMDPTGLLQYAPTPVNRRFARSMRVLDALVRRIVADCRTAARKRPAPSDDDTDVVTALVCAYDADTRAPLSDRQVRDEVMSLLIAAVESVSRTLTWAVHLLDAHPQVLAALHREVDACLAGRTATWADLERLPHTRHILSEVLRLYPPGYLISRTAVRDTTLGDGVSVPAGTMVMFSYYALQRDPRLFPGPREFRPERWAARGDDEGTRRAFLPFGLGAHSCLGEAFAWTQMSIVLASLAARHRLRPAGSLPVRPVAAFSLTLTNARVTVESRTPRPATTEGAT
jgi:cytochrome P450